MTTIPTVTPPPSPYPVLVSFAERAKQRRWTVLLRLFLSIPLLVVTVLFGIANFVVVVIGWFGALIMGRTPKFTRDLTAITLRLTLRLYAYQTLLNDRFPSFALEDRADDMVRLAVPEATRMNRWAVFFRIILIIPVGVLSNIVQSGSVPFIVFGWFAALITGWLPAPMYDLNRTVNRFQIRVTAYFLLLVPTYPVGLFGDPAPLPDAPLPPTLSMDAPPAAAVATPPPMPPPPPTWAPPSSGETAVEPSSHPGFYPPPAPTNEIEQPAMHPSWLLVFGKGGRGVLIVAIIIGIPAYAASIKSRIHNSVVIINDQQLIQANNALVGQIAQFGTRGRACQGASDTTACFEANDGRLAGQLTTFSNTLSNASNYNISQSVVMNAVSAANNLAAVFHRVADAGSNQAAFNRANNAAVVNSAANDVLSALNALRTALNNR